MQGIFKVRQLTLLVTLAMFLPSCGQRHSPSKIPSDCDPNSSGQIICLTTFTAIATDPESYNGIDVTVSGFLAIDEGVLSLYANENAYIHKMTEGNVLIVRGPLDVQEKLFKEYGYHYLRLSGKFQANEASAKVEYGVGSIGGQIRSYPLPNRDVPEKREGLNDIRINVQDLSSDNSAK